MNQDPSRRRFATALLTVLSVLTVSTTASNAATATTEAPSQGDSRPGPDIVYWDPPRAPQLENTRGWRADPILVSGSSAYRDGEFLYQDFLYDDSGTYPADGRLAGNAADFVEIRLRLLPDATAVRITYNSMLAPELVAATIALGDSPSPRAIPHGARAVMPAQVFVTVHGLTAEAVDAQTDMALHGVSAQTDLERRQVDVRVPFTVFDPRGKVAVRVGAATGVWDPTAGGYAKSGSGAALYNVAFRYNQPLEEFVTAGQDAALAAGDLSPFFARVDFTKLSAEVTDNSRVPTAGHMNRILASHFETVQGRGSDTGGGGAVGNFACDDTPTGCTYEYAGRLQPFSIFVPEGPPPARGYGLVTNLHGAGGNHNAESKHEEGNQDRILTRRVWDTLAAAFGGSIVVRPLGRGSSYFYWGQAGADTFEVIGDVMRRYPIDASRIIGSGFSMGGCGSYKFAVQFPDFFAGIHPNVGCVASEAWLTAPAPPLGGAATETKQMLGSLRHVPVMSLNGVGDPLVPAHQKYQATLELERLGYRLDDWYFCDEPGWCTHSEYRGYTAEAFKRWTARLAPTPVNPAHITYVLNSAMNEPKYGLDSDQAYWLSNLTVRDASKDPPAGQIGTIDVFSHGFGVGDPTATDLERTVGLGPGDRAGAYHRYTKTWGPEPKIPRANQLDISATNVASVTIDPRRARVDCDARINLDSDGPIDVTLLGCPRAVG